MATKYLKMGWNCDSDKENLDNHSKIPTATWPSLQYVKQTLLEFRLGTYREPDGAPPLRLPRNTTWKENERTGIFLNWADHRKTVKKNTKSTSCFIFISKITNLMKTFWKRLWYVIPGRFDEKVIRGELTKSFTSLKNKTCQNATLYEQTDCCNIIYDSRRK